MEKNIFYKIWKEGRVNKVDIKAFLGGKKPIKKKKLSEQLK